MVTKILYVFLIKVEILKPTFFEPERLLTWLYRWNAWWGNALQHLSKALRNQRLAGAKEDEE